MASHARKLENQGTQTETLISNQVFDSLKLLRKQMELLVPEKPMVCTVSLCAILAQGHVLLEDVPGIGKTTFIKSIAKMLGLDFKRVQFTNDVLPSDVIGVDVYNQETQKFQFHRGPIFTQIVLADELNRASPRTQSALLEAMGEGSVTIEGRSQPLPKPFVVFATQNPNESIGTYPLPESQLDRFAAKIRLDYPSKSKEIEILRVATMDPLASVPEKLLENGELLRTQAALDGVFVADRVLSIAKRVIDASRHAESIKLGISTRGGVSWLRMAKARALTEGRDYVIPDDLLYLATSSLSHRIIPRAGLDGNEAIKNIIAQVDID
jgi:MoxR-like ATPase